MKVRSFHGADIRDMCGHIAPAYKIILHIGWNDAPNKSSGEIVERALIETVLPYAKGYLSSPIPRYDNVKAGFIMHQLRMKLKDMENVIQNNNFDTSCIGRAGLHPNGKGFGTLAMNYISVMRRL